MKEKSFERKSQLLEAALEEFSSKKYDDASLNTIIKNAGISKGTYYYHFKDKQDLYIFLLKSSADAKWEFINSKTSGLEMDFDKMDIFERFKVQARIGVEFAIEHAKYYKLTKMLIKEKGNAIFEVVKDSVGSGSENILSDMINTAIEKGDFRTGFPRDFIQKTIGFMFSNFDEIFYADGKLELEEMLVNLDYYVDFMKQGLGSTSNRVE